MIEPLVSIVIPLYNKEDFILQALKSIVAQTYTSWECIIVDDGSTDSSARLVKEFDLAKNMNCVFLSQRNLGPSAARNAGINSAKGAYIAFLDADDIWLPSKLEKQVTFMEQNPNVGLCLTNYVIFNNLKQNRFRAIRAKEPLAQIENWLNMRGFGGLVESTGLLRSEQISDKLLFDQSMRTTEGLDFTLKWFLNGRVEILTEFLTLYRISANQLHSNVDLIRENVLRVSLKYPFLVKSEKNLNAYHRAYFKLSVIRDFSFAGKLKGMFIQLLKLDCFFFRMASSIISRNVLARFISPRMKRQLTSYLNRISQ